MFDTRLTLDPNDRLGFFDPGAVVLKAGAIEDALEDGRFFGIICFRRRGSLRSGVGNGEENREGNQAAHYAK